MKERTGEIRWRRLCTLQTIQNIILFCVSAVDLPNEKKRQTNKQKYERQWLYKLLIFNNLRASGLWCQLT